MLPSDFLGWLTFILKHAGPIFIILIGCLCVVALERVADLRSTPLFCIVRVLMLLDIINITVGKIHDIPDEILGKEVFGSIFITVVLLVQCIRWFAQLLALPMLASLHFLSLYRPVRFRKLRLIHGYAIVALFLSTSVLLTVPLLTECCGYVYYINGAFWAFDFEKPGTALYTQLNLVLQGICVTVMLLCDIFILYKVYNMRGKMISTTLHHTHTTQPSGGTEPSGLTSSPIVESIRVPTRQPPRKTSKGSIEKKLTLSFLLLSLTFILPTIGFNLRPSYVKFNSIHAFLNAHFGWAWEKYQEWAAAGLIGAICLVVENFKWFVYTLTTTLIRREFVRILKCQGGR